MFPESVTSPDMPVSDGSVANSPEQLVNIHKFLQYYKPIECDCCQDIVAYQLRGVNSFSCSKQYCFDSVMGKSKVGVEALIPVENPAPAHNGSLSPSEGSAKIDKVSTGGIPATATSAPAPAPVTSTSISTKADNNNSNQSTSAVAQQPAMSVPMPTTGSKFKNGEDLLNHYAQSQVSQGYSPTGPKNSSRAASERNVTPVPYLNEQSSNNKSNYRDQNRNDKKPFNNNNGYSKYDRNQQRDDYKQRDGYKPRDDYKPMPRVGPSNNVGRNNNRDYSNYNSDNANSTDSIPPSRQLKSRNQNGNDANTNYTKKYEQRAETPKVNDQAKATGLPANDVGKRRLGLAPDAFVSSLSKELGWSLLDANGKDFVKCVQLRENYGCFYGKAFWMQEDSKKLDTDIQNFMTQTPRPNPVPPATLTKGSLCLALFDGNFYRGELLDYDNANGVWNVFYIDYGNIDVCHVKDIYKLPRQFLRTPRLLSYCMIDAGLAEELPENFDAYVTEYIPIDKVADGQFLVRCIDLPCSAVFTKKF